MNGKTFVIDAWIADADGYLVSEIHSPASNDDWLTFAKNCIANGQVAINQGIDPTKSKPPIRPSIAATPDPLVTVYAAAVTDTQRIDAIAQKLGLK